MTERVEEDNAEEDNKRSIRINVWNDYVSGMMEKYSITKDDVTSILTSISKTGFCNEITGTYSSYRRIFYITDICKRFINMIDDR